MMERPPAPAIHEKAVQDSQEIVARGAFDIPIGTQPLVTDQNLLADNEETIGNASGCAAALLQALEVLGGIEKAIRVVDPQPLDLPLADQFKDERMDGGKHFGIFHADCHQLINVEETAVIDLVGGDSPVTQTVRLPAQQLLQP